MLPVLIVVFLDLLQVTEREVLYFVDPWPIGSIDFCTHAGLQYLVAFCLFFQECQALNRSTKIGRFHTNTAKTTPALHMSIFVLTFPEITTSGATKAFVPPQTVFSLVIASPKSAKTTERWP